MRRRIPLIFMVFLSIILVSPFYTLAEETATQGKISLDIKGMDIIDALKLLSKQANLNIVAGRNVRGKVTLFLKDVNPWYAFQIILAANNLAYEEENGIITVMAERDYELMYGEKFNERQEVKTVRLRYAKAADISKALNQIKTKVGTVVVDENSNTLIIKDTPTALTRMTEAIKELDIETETKVYSLNYAVAEKVQEKVTNTISKAGTVEIDERTNKIIVKDTPQKMVEIDKLISELDEQTKQVLIEAKIIQIDLDDEYKLGVNWDAFFNGLDNIKLGSAFQAVSTTLSPTSSTSVGGGVFKLGELSEDKYQATVKALETLGRTNVLSSPRVLTVNNEEAKVLVGTNQPYATSTTSQSGDNQVTSYNITYLDLGVKLHVTPTINKDNFITMKIKPEVSSQGTPYTYGQYDDQVPVVTTSMTETTVMVKDSTTIVLAGLMESRDEEDVNKVPILGDLPILGGLFRSRSKGSATVSEKKELVIFITPSIVTGDMDSAGEIEDYTAMINKLETWEEQNEFFKVKEKTGLTTAEEEAIGRAVEEKLKGMGLPKEYEEGRTIQILEQPVQKDEEAAEAIEPVFQKRPYEILERGSEEDRYGEATEAVPLGPVVVSRHIYSAEEYSEFVRSAVHEIINQNLTPRLKGEVYVEFSILQNGLLKEEPKILQSSNEGLEELTVMSIKEASPFPPFPSEIAAGEKTYKILISY